MTTFYRLMELLGFLGTCWVGGLLIYLDAPLWTWAVTVPAWILVEFGCFASRDRKHDEQMGRRAA